MHLDFFNFQQFFLNASNDSVAEFTNGKKPPKTPQSLKSSLDVEG